MTSLTRWVEATYLPTSLNAYSIIDMTVEGLITNSQNQIVKYIFHLILSHPLLLPPPIPPSIRVFSNESTLCMSSKSSIPSEVLFGRFFFKEFCYFKQRHFISHLDWYFYLKNNLCLAASVWSLIVCLNVTGSRFKRIAYPLGLATLGATVCYPVQSVIIAKVAGKKAYATSQQVYEAVKSLWTKNNKKLPEHKEETKLGSADEIEIPAETTHNLKHSVPLPTELNSETKTKSTSGLVDYIVDPELRHIISTFHMQSQRSIM
ncbi:hypothetical protein FD755_025216 [Muntiacus reevesi]|uniref:MICOS complex subunit n=1 Tax=Muntiacus reevesi TaxID=9886 RepID=A0A5N3UPD7_MUNRE|nr:hypothetical protein FD755_025216 [Muntiacus reevesi]